eukprot:TRINITY_DN5661_c0_g4_i2.p1 TRINITY_DN5661_c0_g4~~TRINITY_DN5661_c0_g4_i2.p1  ORF type:complete len:182 (+),score=35.70 TRINITY_DN5661_c0_g4_i2:507-1052(+)
MPKRKDLWTLHMWHTTMELEAQVIEANVYEEAEWMYTKEIGESERQLKRIKISHEVIAHAKVLGCGTKRKNYCEATFGPQREHQRALELLVLGSHYLRNGDNNSAMEILEEVMEVYSRYPPSDETILADTLEMIGEAYERQEHYDAALGYFKQAEEIANRSDLREERWAKRHCCQGLHVDL